LAAVPAAATQRPGELRYRLRCIDKLDYPFKGDERLLDIGCGNGGVAELLSGRVAEVVAVDVEPSDDWEHIDGVTFAVADGEQLPFEDGEFDLVHSKDSLHHMEHPETALAEYRRVLRPGGTALIVEANRYNPVFFVHMTKMLGHEHFTRSRFQQLVRGAFSDVRFGWFEARYVPQAERFRDAQERVEELLERTPGYARLAAYNYAVASR
jgi:demethylmenaquinone methyltransferase/2-methoxy-6-polyprenyl-1,4-benzoquinol methylase